MEKGTIICEYSGNVYLQGATLFDGNDDIMELLLGNSAYESLVICPTTHANLGRFLNGTKNNKKQNVKIVILII